MKPVLLIGAGGIGCGAALALAAGGADELLVLDDDVVDESNLQRQVLHSAATVGIAKVDSLSRTLAGRFPSVRVTTERGRFTAETADRWLEACAVAIDGSDSLPTKFLANDAAVLLRKPVVHAAAVGTMAQLVTVPARGRPCYRCLFEELPQADDAAPSCDEAGVLGPVPGLIGALAAAEALRIVRGETPAYIGRLFRFEAQRPSLRATPFRPNPTCAVCGHAPSIRTLNPATYARPAAACRV